LEAQGYRVRLIAVFPVRITGRGECEKKLNARTVDVLVPIKEANEPLAIDRLIRTICYPDFFRRTIFRTWETFYFAETEGNWENDCRGYGESYKLEDNEENRLKYGFDFVSEVPRNGQTVLDNITQMIANLEKQTGIKAELERN
jgi:hypothetical protein